MSQVIQEFDDFNCAGGAFKKSTILNFLQLGNPHVIHHH
jgi:hypothetical protein